MIDHCPACQAPLPLNISRCPHCGCSVEDINGEDIASHCLPKGHLLNGKYEIIGLLGQGGFGITYRAKNRLINKEMAIKELFISGENRRRGKTVYTANNTKGGVSFAEEKQKFLEEARTLMDFRNPGVIGIHDIFEENNTAYYVMELLEGQTLGKLIEQKGKLDPQEVLTYARKVCEALIEVHAKGLLHRDIKPDNIFIAQNGRVVLLDFGSARSFVAGKTSALTRLVSPGYSPPEQYVSHGKFLPSIDFYALGATLWHALTGRVPPNVEGRLFKLSNGQSDLEDFANALPADTPAGLKQAILKSLDIKPQNRPQSAKEFLDILGDGLEEEGPNKRNSPKVREQGFTAPQEHQLPASKKRQPLKTLAILALLIAIASFGYAFYTYYLQQKLKEPNLASLNQNRTQPQPQEPTEENVLHSSPTPMPDTAKTAPEPIQPKEALPLAKPKPKPAPPPPVRPTMTPAALERAIQRKLDLEGLPVSAEVSPTYVVTLEGKVEQTAQRNRARAIARSFPQTDTVIDHILVGRSPTELASLIRQTLVNRGINGLDVNVSTDYVVLLKGVVNDDTVKQQIISIARSFPEVKEVKDQVFVVVIQ